MDILLLSFSCVAPFIIYLFLGFTSKKILKISSATFLDINTIVFRIFLPLNLFFNIYRSDFASVNLSRPLLIGLICVLVFFLLAMIYYGKRNIPNADKSVMIQNSFRSNFILLGIELTESIMGTEVSALGGVMTVMFIPLFNVLAVLVFSFYAKEKVSFIKVLARILKNPLIISSLLALVLNYFNVSVSDWLFNVLFPLGKMATPLALFALGGRFVFTTDRESRKLLFEGLLFRLILIPLIVMLIIIPMGIRGEALALFLVLFGGPVAVTSYTMAQQMGGNEQLAAQLLVYTTVFSTFTLFVFISIFKSYGFF
ncbi:MAG TPA: AEC family transporter [Clostridiaceae bacterium]|nr:AEC family transporter [Clostridiaceae bacterium]